MNNDTPPVDPEAALRLRAVKEAVDGALEGRCTIAFAIDCCRALCLSLERETWKGAA